MAESKCNGVVLVNAYLRAPGMIRQAERIAEELRLRGSSVRIVKNGAFLSEVRKNMLTLSEKCPLLDHLIKKIFRLFCCDRDSSDPGKQDFLNIISEFLHRSSLLFCAFLLCSIFPDYSSVSFVPYFSL